MAGRSALLATSAQRIKSYDAAIIGCGVVGVSVTRALSLTGLSTVILEAGDGPFSGASGNNSGIVCTGFDAPLRSLERRSLVAGRAELLSLGNRVLEPHAFDPRGSLVADFGETDSTHPLAAPAQEEAEAAYALQRIVDECRDVEDVHSRVLGRTEALLREPSLAANLRSAALVAGEVVFDPVMLYMALLRDAITAGAELRVGCRVVEAAAPVPVTRDQSDTEVACGGWGEVDRAAAVTRARSASRALAGIGVPWALEAGRLVEGRNLPEEEQAGGGASEGVFRSLEAGDYWLLQLRQRQVGKSAPLRGAGGGAATRGSAKARTQPEGEPRPDEAAERRVTGDEADAAAEEAASVRAGMVFNCTGNGADMVDVLMRAALGEHYGGIAPASALVSGRDRPASAVTDGTWRVRPRRGQYAVLGPLPPPGTPATGPVVAADAAPASGSAGSASSASGATHGPAHPGGSAGMGLTVAAASAAVPRSPLQPLPSDATKGVYLFAPAMPPGANAALVVGPTAQDVPADDPVAQWSESLEGASERPAPALDRGVHERWSASLSPTEEALLSTLAEHRLRNFEVAREAPKGVKGAATVPAGGNIGSNVWGVVGRYGGLRPAVEGRRDYRVRHEGCGWWTVAGIRSTGASASLGLGRMVASAALAEAICAGAGAAAVADLAAHSSGAKHGSAADYFAGRERLGASATAAGGAPGGPVRGAAERGPTGQGARRCSEAAARVEAQGVWWVGGDSAGPEHARPDAAPAFTEEPSAGGSGWADGLSEQSLEYDHEARRAAANLRASQTEPPSAWREYGRAALASVFWGHREETTAVAAAAARLRADAAIFAAPATTQGLSATGLPRPAPTALATWDTDDSDCDTSSLADLQEAPDAEPLQPSDAQRREVRAKLPEASELDTAALLAGGAFDFGNPKAAEALAVEASLLGEEHVLSGVSSALAAVAEAIESASLDAADMALDECYGSGGMAASAMPTAMSAGFEIPGDLDAGRAFQDRRLRSSPLVEEFCLSLMQEIRRHGLDAEQVLRLPAHEWPVTGSVTVAGQTIPVMHALTRIVWAVRGGLLRAVPLGSDWETAYGEHPARR